jgi:thiamine biosynthesis lipoprotein
MQPALGTWLELTLWHDSQTEAHAFLSEAFKKASELERALSIFDPLSEISLVNQTPPGRTKEITGQLYRVLELGQKIESSFSNAFRLMPGCPHAAGSCYRIRSRAVMRFNSCSFDLGGVAKGFIVDVLHGFLKRRIHNGNFSVNAGGDLRVRGGQQVELRIPTRTAEKRFVLSVHDASVAISSLQSNTATSGQALAKYPLKGGILPRRIVSCAVVASKCMVADAITKVALFHPLSEEAFARFGIYQIYQFDVNGKILGTLNRRAE